MLKFASSQSNGVNSARAMEGCLDEALETLGALAVLARPASEGLLEKVTQLPVEDALE